MNKNIMVMHISLQQNAQPKVEGDMFFESPITAYNYIHRQVRSIIAKNGQYNVEVTSGNGYNKNIYISDGDKENLWLVIDLY